MRLAILVFALAGIAPASAAAITLQPGSSLGTLAERAEWYVELNGVVQGPLTVQQVTLLLKSGAISETTRVRREGETQLQALSATPGMGAALVEARITKERGWRKPNPRDDVRFAGL